MSDTLVFIPAWNEEENLPGVLDDLHAELPDADVLVVDDGSTDRTADVAREHGAEVLSFGANRGLPVGIAAGLPLGARARLRVLRPRRRRRPAPGRASSRGCSRSCAADACDVAVGSRFVSGEGYAPYRYQPDRTRRFGTAVLRRAMALVLGRPFGDATSGLYAVNAKALPLLAEPFTTRGARGRGADPHRRRRPAARGGAGEHGARASGESKLRGGRRSRSS